MNADIRHMRIHIFCFRNHLYFSTAGNLAAIGQTGCNKDRSIVSHHDCVKLVFMLLPESCCFFRSHDEQGSGKSIRKRAIRADDRHRNQSAVSRISRPGIDDMVITDLVLLKVTLIGARK